MPLAITVSIAMSKTMGPWEMVLRMIRQLSTEPPQMVIAAVNYVDLPP